MTDREIVRLPNSTDMPDELLQPKPVRMQRTGGVESLPLPRRSQPEKLHGLTKTFRSAAPIGEPAAHEVDAPRD
jgi:hypothetical protein